MQNQELQGNNNPIAVRLIEIITTQFLPYASTT